MRVKGKKRISAPMGTNIKPTGRSISHERQAISGRYPIAVATLQSETGNNANNKEKRKEKEMQTENSHHEEGGLRERDNVWWSKTEQTVQ